MKTRWTFFFTLLMIIAAGCSNAPMETSVPEANPALKAQITPSKEPTESQNPSLPTQGVDTQMLQSITDPLTADLQNLIDKAKENLADRLSVPKNQVNLIKVYDVTWQDSSLGCPQDGMMYAQVLTAGYLIQLEHGGIQFEYHSNKGTSLVFCENPVQPLPGLPDSY